MPLKATSHTCAWCQVEFVAIRVRPIAYCSRRCAATANALARLPELERIWARTIRTVWGCWLWTGSRLDTGYGYLQQGNRRLLVHRVAYGLAYGPIPAGLVIDHLCATPQCINPEHLEAVSQGENVRRGSRWRHRRGAPIVRLNRNHERCRACRVEH